MKVHDHGMSTLLAGRYPRWVYGSNAPDSPSVFAAHDDWPPDVLETCFVRLRDAGYRCISCDEFVESLDSRRRDRRLVLLTFDDGLRSLYDVTFRLLLKYGLRATAFVNPGLIDQECQDEAKPRRLCSWSELREMQRSGCVDVQSHGMFHDRTICGPSIQSFWSPSAMGDRMMNACFARKMFFSRASVPLGHPLWENAPFFSVENPRAPDEAAIAASTKHVTEHGGARFFDRADWARHLRDVVACSGGATASIDRDSVQRRMRSDLEASKARIEEELSGHFVRHLAYPWWVGSEMATNASRGAGYVSNFWGVQPYWRHGPADQFHVPRISLDWVFRLPGAGRRSLGSALWTKAAERIGA